MDNLYFLLSNSTAGGSPSGGWGGGGCSWPGQGVYIWRGNSKRTGAKTKLTANCSRVSAPEQHKQSPGTSCAWSISRSALGGEERAATEKVFCQQDARMHQQRRGSATLAQTTDQQRNRECCETLLLLFSTQTSGPRSYAVGGGGGLASGARALVLSHDTNPQIQTASGTRELEQGVAAPPDSCLALVSPFVLPMGPQPRGSPYISQDLPQLETNLGDLWHQGGLADIECKAAESYHFAPKRYELTTTCQPHSLKQ